MRQNLLFYERIKGLKTEKKEFFGVDDQRQDGIADCQGETGIVTEIRNFIVLYDSYKNEELTPADIGTISLST